MDHYLYAMLPHMDYREGGPSHGRLLQIIRDYTGSKLHYAHIPVDQFRLALQPVTVVGYEIYAVMCSHAVMLNVITQLCEQSRLHW